MAKPITLTDATFTQAVRDRSGVTLVDFWAPWCGPCQLLGPVVDAIGDEYADRLTVAKLDVDVNPETAGNYRVMGIPTLLVFCDGTVTERITGYVSKRHLSAVLDRALGRCATESAGGTAARSGER